MDWIAKTWLAIVSPFILSNVIVPTVFLFGSVTFRWLRELPLSCGADTLLAIAVFDGAAIGSPRDFARYMSSATLQPYVTQISFVMLVATAVIWVAVVSKLEPLAEAGETEEEGYTKKQFLAAGFGFAVAVILVAIHLITYRG